MERSSITTAVLAAGGIENQETVRRARRHPVKLLEMSKEALVEFEASQKVVPNRFRTLAGAARAARDSGSVEAAKRYYRMLTVLAVGGDGNRPEISEAVTHLAQN
jgi:hypothetical protein